VQTCAAFKKSKSKPEKDDNLQAALVDLGFLFDLLGQYPPKSDTNYSTFYIPTVSLYDYMHI